MPSQVASGLISSFNLKKNVYIVYWSYPKATITLIIDLPWLAGVSSQKGQGFGVIV